MEQLIDDYNRKIDYLRLSVTDRCNLRCMYCMPQKGIRLLDRKELLTFSEILRAVEILSELGIKKVRFTGGEPLLRDNILELINDINKIPGIKNLAITTNGILLSRFLKDLYKAGIRRINISVDSMDPRKYKRITRGGSLEKVLGAVEDSIKMGFDSIKINVVITNFLDREDSLEFIKFALEKPVSVRFIEMMPVSDLSTIECSSNLYGSIGKVNIGTGDILRSMSEFGKVRKLKESKIYGPAIYYEIDGSKGRIGFIENKKEICGLCNRVRLTPKGTLKSCLFSVKELDIKKQLRNGSDNERIKRMIRYFIEKKPKDRSCNISYRIKSESKIAGSMNKIGG